jgi:hypothetical protein
MRMKRTTLCLALLVLSACGVLAGSPENSPAEALKFDADAKDYTPSAGESVAPFAFLALNTSKSPLTINSLRTSCGCTVAQLPSTPYTLQPGSNVTINVSMNLTGKQGQITKAVTVDSSVGVKTLIVRANIPAQTN